MNAINSKQSPLISDPTRSKNNLSGKINHFKRLVPFYFYIPTIIIALTAAVKTETTSIPVVCGLMIAGWLSWGLFEYAFHRFVLHRQAAGGNVSSLPGNATHLAHHRSPSAIERLYIPLHEGAPVAVFFWLASWLISGSWQLTAYLYTGFILGYLLYEWLDYEAHHGKSRNRLMRFYKKYHLQHHHVDEAARYGVTSPLFDYLFGTYQLQHKATARRINRQEVRK